MKISTKAIALLSSALLLSACQNTESKPIAGDLKVVTWNIEHLAEHNGKGCKARNNEDYAKLRNYAHALNADVVALQEVESADAVHRVFPRTQWQVILSNRVDSQTYTCRKSGRQSTQQKVAYAIKKTIDVTHTAHLTQFSDLQPGLRQGLQVSLSHGGETINLVNLHLKSGCFTQDYLKQDKEACQLLGQQANILDRFLEAKPLDKTHWVVLGDFNHRLADKQNRMRKDLMYGPGLYSASTAPSDHLENTTDDLRGCHIKYPAPIDHILLSKSLAPALVNGSVQFHNFKNMEPKAMLSDHCALSASFSFSQ